MNLNKYFNIKFLNIYILNNLNWRCLFEIKITKKNHEEKL